MWLETFVWARDAHDAVPKQARSFALINGMHQASKTKNVTESFCDDLPLEDSFMDFADTPPELAKNCVQ